MNHKKSLFMLFSSSFFLANVSADQVAELFPLTNVINTAIITNSLVDSIDNIDHPFCSTRISGDHQGNISNSGLDPNISAILESSPGSLVLDKPLRWPNNSYLKVAMDFSNINYKEFSYICNNNDSRSRCTDKVINTIMQQASEWSLYGNIYFEYSPIWNEGDIRIMFTKKGGAWSAIGTRAKLRDIKKATMNLDIAWWNRSWIMHTITHEFGHAIGLEHEHLRSDIPYQLDENKVIDFYKSNQGWSETDIRHNVLRRININSDNFGTTEYDDLSIMRYSFPRKLVVNNELCPSDSEYYCVEPNYELSNLDIEGISEFYPDVIYDRNNPITGIKVTSFPDSGDHCDDYYPEWVNIDLNKGSGGNFIYLCIARTPESKSLTNIMASNNDCNTGYKKVDRDLNHTVEGEYIYLCTTTNTRFTPITSVEITTHPNSNANKCNLPYRVNHDLNAGAGGDFIYLCYD